MKFDEPVLLVGNGAIDDGAITLATQIGGPVLAADGGAKAALQYGFKLQATIGDMDSISKVNQDALFGEIIRVTSQDTTDFEKCLSMIQAPLILGVGFLGGRLDHELAALNALVQSAQNVVLIGEVDIVFLLPSHFSVSLPIGTRISLFPMGKVSGVTSTGLKWEISDRVFSPSTGISTSNQIATPNLTIINPKQPLLCILPRAHLTEALKSFNL